MLSSRLAARNQNLPFARDFSSRRRILRRSCTAQRSPRRQSRSCRRRSRRSPRRPPRDRSSVPRQTCCCGCDASTMIAAGVPRDQPRSIRRHAIAADRPSPISTTTVTPFGWSCAIADANASSSCPDTTRNADATPRCVTGMPADAGAAMALRDAGHDVVRDARVLQRQRFFAAAAEHERVAALQPDHAPAAPGGANHQRVDRRLRHRVAAGALADEEALRPPRVAQDAVVDQRVVQHQVGRAQPRDRPCASAARDRQGPRRRARHVPSQPRILRSTQPRHARSAIHRGPARRRTKLAHICALACARRPSASYSAFSARSSLGLRCLHRHAFAPPHDPLGARLLDPRAQVARQQQRRALRAAARSAPARRRSSKSPASRRRAGRRRSGRRWRWPGRRPRSRTPDAVPRPPRPGD